MFDALMDALRSLRANTMRSVLTTLGIIIGVSAVIVMVAVGNGAKARVENLIQSLGANIMMVHPGSSLAKGVRGGSGTLPTLTGKDAKAILNNVSGVVESTPYVRGSAQIIAGNLNWGTIAYGVEQGYLNARGWKINTGRTFTPEEIKSSGKVAILGQTVADNLFPGEDPLYRSIRVKRVPFTVIGTLEKKGETGHGDQDDVVFIPLSTAKKRVLGGRYLGGDRVNGIVVQAASSDLVTLVEERVAELLRIRHKILPGKEDDFRVRNLAEMLNTRASSSEAMGLLLMAVASVSLLVGGIGIMNIMLVSVSERTREIGLRMAVGATARDILAQFIIEAVVLSLIGGLIGVILGVGGSLMIASMSQWPAIINSTSILLAFGFSAAVGVFFGFYPARKASLLDPIEALRFE
ncbi:ABC transporter permease [Dethiosulfatarculus sandiegensis]|uniref:Multidrug ABC transporter substrate-binding protein n=1 Tax=Dethiosulfatarculus sandiegensis TaxID=1429043 RepID=A0A0D2GCM5_9BACT|nr:ABC transporter permease [Dethiosulfatarculus sandiegensis]KIX12692.1 multidrug ABC transporter substrate-binding protein [Dethiosulfatarculus sandiegensis]